MQPPCQSIERRRYREHFSAQWDYEQCNGVSDPGIARSCRRTAQLRSKRTLVCTRSAQDPLLFIKGEVTSAIDCSRSETDFVVHF